MKKLILTILTVLTALALAGCAEEENNAVTNLGRVYTAELANNTVLDADNSYFVVNVNNAVEIPNTVVERVEGETDEEYNYRYTKAVQEAYSKGVNIKVEGIGLDAQTIVLNKDNGTITDSTKNNTLVIVKKEEATDTKPGLYQIQVLLHAKTAVNAKNVTISVGNQKFLFNNFNVKPARIWRDMNENEITTIHIPDNVTDDRGDVVKKGISIVSEPVKVDLYAYDNVNKKVEGPKAATNDITGLITKDMVAPFVIEDFVDNSTILAGCLENGQYKCGITIYSYETISTEKTLSLTLANNLTDTLTVNSISSILVKGTKPVEYNILPLTSMYLEETNSAAIFDVKATTGNTITAADIKVTGTYNGAAQFTEDTTATSLTTGKYIIKEITPNSHYRLFILASEAAAAAANDAAGNLVISVKGHNHTYKSTDLSVGKISYAYIAGNKINSNYKIKQGEATSIDIKLNYFGPKPALYTYNSAGNAANFFTTEKTFMPNLNTVNSGTSLQVNNGTCTQNAQAVDCTLTVTANNAITSANAATAGNVILSYTDVDSTSTPITLPNTQINFYTTEDTTTTAVSSY